MPGEIMLVNPRRKRRKGGARRKMSALQRKYFGGGRRKRRSANVTVMNANPRRKRTSSRRRRVTRFRRNPTSIAGYLRRGRSSMGRFSLSGFVSDTLIPGAVGAAGAMAVDYAVSALSPYLPASLQDDTLEPFVALAGAIGVGMIAQSVAGAKTGNQIMNGAVTVQLYNLMNAYMGGSQSGTGYYTGYAGPAYTTGYYAD